MKLKTLFTITLALACGLLAAGCGHANSTTELIPAAVLVNQNLAESLTIIAPDQKFIANVKIENPGYMSVGDVVPAGKYSKEKANLPLVYAAYAAGAEVKLSQNDQIETLRKLDSLSKIAGSNGQQAIAFADVAYTGSSLKSSLYTANIDNLGLSTPVFQIEDVLQQWALAPLAVEVKDGQPGGVWYTTTGWGVGGPGIVFPITQGLNYFDVQAGSNTEYLSREESLQGLSPDNRLAGSIASSSSGDHAMTVTNLETRWTLKFPLRKESDMGAGYAVFPPNGQYAAWLEAGSSPYDPYQYNYVVRVGNLSEAKVIFEIDAGAAAQTLNADAVTYLRPVGWLVNNSLLIEARGENWEDANIVRLDLNDGKLYQFAGGAFVSFLY
jgi:hypothetical protein